MAKRKIQDIPKAEPDLHGNNEDMKQAIIAAYFEIQNINAKNKQQEKEKWQNKIFIDRSKVQSKKALARKLMNLYYDFIDVKNILFIKKEDIREGLGTTSLLKLILTALLWIIKIALYVCIIIAILVGLEHTSYLAICVACAFFSFIIARFVRIVSFEIESMTDREYLISIFSCVMSFSAIILASISI